MPVDQAGHDDPPVAGQGLAGTIAGADFVTRTDSDDPAVVDDDGACLEDRLVTVHGNHVVAEHDQVGGDPVIRRLRRAAARDGDRERCERRAHDPARGRACPPRPAHHRRLSRTAP